MKQTTKALIERILREEGYIDNFFCIDEKITTRLGAVIHNLRNEGWYFDDEKSGYIGETKNWRYVLKSAPPLK